MLNHADWKIGKGGHAGHLTGPRAQPWTAHWWSESGVGMLQGQNEG